MQQALLDQILPILSAVRDDREKLERIVAFLESEILPEIKEEEGEITIPEKYEAVVNDIAQNMTCGLISHLNMDSLEVEWYHQNEELNFWEEEDEEDEDEENRGEKETFKHRQWEKRLTFHPLESFESFRIMENFAAQVSNPKVQNILTDLLNRRKPFANFNAYIHNADEREDWFKFRDAAYEQRVREAIYVWLQEENNKSNVPENES